jgi:hypothetical protein
MKNPIPWIGSVRSLIALIVIIVYCIYAPPVDLKELAMMAMVFYFTKQRTEGK